MAIHPITSDPMQIKVKGFKIFKDRHGKLRCYHRATGKSIDLEKHDPGSASFFAECGKIAVKQDAEPKPGTLGLLIKEYKKKGKWRELKPKTREWYEMGFQYLRPINDFQLETFTPAEVYKILDKAKQKKGWYFANLLRTALYTVFKWGVPREYVDVNPCMDIEKYERPKDRPRANRPWTAEERKAVMGSAAAHLKPILAGMLYTGIDPCDAVRLPVTKYLNGAFDLSRQKTGNPVYKGVPRVLKAILADMPEHDAMTLFATSRGTPWTKSGLDSAWHKLRGNLLKEGKIGKGLTLKGLRHTHATMVRELGEDHGAVARALGDKSESMGAWYSRDADMKTDADRIVKAFDKHHKKV